MNETLLLVISYSTIFLPAMLTSRIALLLVGKYRFEWYVVFGVHLISFVIVLFGSPSLELFIVKAGGFSRFYSMTNGTCVDTQLFLMIGDFVCNGLVRTSQNPTSRLAFLAKHSTVTNAALSLVVFVAGFTEAFFSSTLVDVAVSPEIWLSRQIEHAFHRDRDSLVLATSLQQTFPDEYQRLTKSYQQSLRPLITDAPKFRDKFSDLSRRLNHDVTTFVKSHRTDVLNAPDKQLYGVAQKQLDLITSLRTIPVICAALATGETTRAKSDPAWNTAAGRQLGAAGSQYMAAALFAIKAGIDHPVLRDTTTLKPATALALSANLSLFADRSTLNLLSNRYLLNSADVASQCDAGFAMARAVASLPESQSAEVVAYEVAQKLEQL